MADLSPTFKPPRRRKGARWEHARKLRKQRREEEFLSLHGFSLAEELCSTCNVSAGNHINDHPFVHSGRKAD